MKTSGYLRKSIRVLMGKEESDVKEYFLAYLRKIESRFHTLQADDLKKYEMTLENALTKFYSLSQSELATLNKEFEILKDSLLSYFNKDGTADDSLARFLYLICRLKKPEMVIETGVWYGVSSTVILAALEKNLTGLLQSIDLAPVDPAIKIEIGKAVPENLKKNWQLHLGHSRTILPKILKKTETIEIFIHDSEHSYRNMYNEYKNAWNYLKLGGLLVSDDISVNNAFIKFSNSVKKEPVVIKRKKGGYFGFIVK